MQPIRSFGFPKLPLTLLAGAILGAHVAPAQQPANPTGELAGMVTAADGRPVPDAEVSLLGLGAARTDSSGRFAFRGVPAGMILIRVLHLGFPPMMRSVSFDGIHPLNLALRLDGSAVMLAPVVVRDSVGKYGPDAFARRRATAQGLYLTEDDITARHAQLVEHLLANLQGLQVDSAGIVHVDRGRTSIYGDNCMAGVQLFVDGVAVSDDFSLRNLSTTAVRAIEVYRGVASTPAELRSPRVACGTVAIWMK
jgi:hypothetical protein